MTLPLGPLINYRCQTYCNGTNLYSCYNKNTKHTTVVVAG